MSSKSTRPKKCAPRAVSGVCWAKHGMPYQKRKTETCPGNAGTAYSSSPVGVNQVGAVAMQQEELRQMLTLAQASLYFSPDVYEVQPNSLRRSIPPEFRHRLSSGQYCFRVRSELGHDAADGQRQGAERSDMRVGHRGGGGLVETGCSKKRRQALGCTTVQQLLKEAQCLGDC